MLWIAISFITIAVLFVVLGFSKRTWRVQKKQFISLVGLLWICAGLVTVVPTGHTGVLTTFGKVEDIKYEAGIHIKSPFQNVVVMDNRTQKASLTLECFSSDIQEVAVVYSINYQIQKDNAQTIYKTIGTDYYNVVMVPRIQETVKSVISKYDADQLIDSREKLSEQITAILVESLGKSNIDVVSTSIENLDFSDAFTQAVEDKQVALQRKLKAQTEQEQKTMEEEELAKRKEIIANAEAEVKKIQADADASVKETQAGADKKVAELKADAAAYAGQKDAEVNTALSATLTADLLKYYEIMEWDGKLPSYYVSGTDTVLPILGNPNTTTNP